MRDSGAHLGWVYGQGFPLWYLPMGLTDNPTVGLVLASLWNAVTIVLPLWLVARVAAPGAPGIARFMTGLAAVLLLANPITRSAFLFIHVDAVSMAWAIVACLALHAAAVPAGALIVHQEPSQSHFALRYFNKDAQPQQPAPPAKN